MAVTLRYLTSLPVGLTHSDWLKLPETDIRIVFQHAQYHADHLMCLKQL